MSREAIVEDQERFIEGDMVRIYSMYFIYLHEKCPYEPQSYTK